MIKFSITLSLAMLALSGCTHIQTGSATNTSTRGLLLCKENALCPIATVAWDESSKELLTIKVSLNSTTNDYEIKQISFTDGQLRESFAAKTATKTDVVFGQHRSRNQIQVSRDMFKPFLHSKEISLEILTDKGTISNYILKDGVKAPILKELKSVYP